MYPETAICLTIAVIAAAVILAPKQKPKGGETFLSYDQTVHEPLPEDAPAHTLLSSKNVPHQTYRDQVRKDLWTAVGKTVSNPRRSTSAADIMKAVETVRDLAVLNYPDALEDGTGTMTFTVMDLYTSVSMDVRASVKAGVVMDVDFVTAGESHDLIASGTCPGSLDAAVPVQPKVRYQGDVVPPQFR